MTEENPSERHDLVQGLRDEIGRAVVGQKEVVELLLISLVARGHALFEGVPGLAKTLLVQSLAAATGLRFARIQFTPDLLPSDITGTDVLERDPQTGKRRVRFVSGPLFANLVLADEINRTPPKTQSALLQAMQEGAVTCGRETRELPQPFLVCATQNPIEQEGTYPLPEAQLDRFLFRIRVGYPSAEEESEIVARTTSGSPPALEARLSEGDLVRLQEQALAIPVGDDVTAFAVQLVRATRPGEGAPEFVNDLLAWGAGPRASQALILGGKARAALQGRHAVTRDDVRALAGAVLAHRILLNFRAQAERVTAEDIVARLVDFVDPALDI